MTRLLYFWIYSLTNEGHAVRGVTCTTPKLTREGFLRRTIPASPSTCPSLRETGWHSTVHSFSCLNSPLQTQFWKQLHRDSDEPFFFRGIIEKEKPVPHSCCWSHHFLHLLSIPHPQQHLCHPGGLHISGMTQTPNSETSDPMIIILCFRPSLMNLSIYHQKRPLIG